MTKTTAEIAATIPDAIAAKAAAAFAAALDAGYPLFARDGEDTVSVVIAREAERRAGELGWTPQQCALVRLDYLIIGNELVAAALTEVGERW